MNITRMTHEQHRGDGLVVLREIKNILYLDGLRLKGKMEKTKKHKKGNFFVILLFLMYRRRGTLCLFFVSFLLLPIVN